MSRENFKLHLAAGAVFALALFIFFRPLTGGKNVLVTTGLLKSDLMGYTYPNKDFYDRMLAAGRLPLWAKDVATGIPLGGRNGVGAFYPLNLVIYGIFALPFAFNLSLLLHLFLAAFFTYLLVSRPLERSFLAGVLSGLTFALSGFFICHMVHPAMLQVTAYFPLVVLLLFRQIKRATWRNFLALSLVFALQFLAGHWEILYYSLLVEGFLIVCFALFYKKGHKGFSLLVAFATFAGSLVLAMIISAVQILPTLELVRFSGRGGGVSLREAQSYLFPLRDLSYFLFPGKADFKSPVVRMGELGEINVWENYGYLGRIPLFLALFSFVYYLISKRMWGGGIVFRSIENFARSIFPFSSKSKAKFSISEQFTSINQTGERLLETGTPVLTAKASFCFVKTFFCSGLFSLLLILGRETPLFELLWRSVPLMKLFRYPTRLMSFLGLSLAVLAGIGLDILLEFVRGKKRELLAAVLGIFLVVFSFADLYSNNHSLNVFAPASWWLDKVEAVEFLQEHLDVNARYGTAVMAELDYALNWDLAVQKELQNIPQPNFNLLYDLPVVNVRTGGLPLARSKKLEEEAFENMLWSGEHGAVVVPEDFLRLASLQGVKFLVSDFKLASAGLELAKQIPFSRSLPGEVTFFSDSGEDFVRESIYTDGVYIYKNSVVMPRARVVADAVWMGSGKAALETVLTEDTDLGNVVVLEGTAEQRGGGDQGIGASGDQEGADAGEGKTRRVKEEKPDGLGNSPAGSAARIAEDGDQEVVVEVAAAEEGYLVLADTWYPGWKAYIENRSDRTDRTYPAEVLRANYNFRAVRVPAGESTVTFRYEPKSFRQGLIISLVGIAVWVGLAVYARRAHRIYADHSGSAPTRRKEHTSTKLSAGGSNG